MQNTIELFNDHDAANKVFDIPELRKEILALCTGATLHPLRATARAWRDTITAIITAQDASVEHHKWSRCHHVHAVKRGCIRCIKYAVVNSGVNLGNIVCGLCEHGYYGLATMLTPKLQFTTSDDSRKFYNAMYTLLYATTDPSAGKLKTLFARRRRKMQLDPEYVWMWTEEQVVSAIVARDVKIEALVKWIERSSGGITIDAQVAFSDRIIALIDEILLAAPSAFVGIVCALFKRGLDIAAMRVLESVAPFYCSDYGADLIVAAIRAPTGDATLYLRVCEFLRDYRLTQERFYQYRAAAIEAEKYDICLELRKIAIVCGLRHYLTHSDSFIVTTTEQVRCANVFARSATCQNVLVGIVTATEYTADCPLTTNAFIAGLTINSTQQYRRAAFLSLIWSSALNHLGIAQKYKFYYMLNITPTSLISLLGAYNGLTMRTISIDLYTLYLEYGPHIYPDFYSQLYTHANCIVSRVLLGMLSGNIPEIADDEIENLWISRYDMLMAAAIRVRSVWWLERLYQHDETTWSRMHDMQLQLTSTLFYIPIERTSTRGSKRNAATSGQKNRRCKRRRCA